MSRKIKFLAALASLAINAGVIASAATALETPSKTPSIETASSAITVDGHLLVCEAVDGTVICS